MLLLNSHLIWFFERRRNPESFPEGYVEGVWEAVWWSVCTLITGGCENKTQLGVVGRLTAVIWMLAGAALFTYITATITSAMTVETLNSDIQSVNDLKQHKWPVATVTGSTAQTFLERQGLSVQGFPDVDAACAALGGQQSEGGGLRRSDAALLCQEQSRQEAGGRRRAVRKAELRHRRAAREPLSQGDHAGDSRACANRDSSTNSRTSISARAWPAATRVANRQHREQTSSNPVGGEHPSFGSRDSRQSAHYQS